VLLGLYNVRIHLEAIMQRKTCKQCGDAKPLKAFYAEKLGKYGRRSKCIECYSVAGSERYYENVDASRAKAKIYTSRWREKNHENAKEVCRKSQRRHIQNLRAKVRDLLGGVCAACGITKPELLHIEHRADDGHEDKKAFNGNKTAYLNHVLTFPGGYQLMCPNCNHRKKAAASTGPTTAASRYATKHAIKCKTVAHALLGGKCKACGETDPVVLCVDHLAGNGRQERKAIGGSTPTYRDVPKNRHKYQLLCHNCNWLKWYKCLEGRR